MGTGIFVILRLRNLKTPFLKKMLYVSRQEKRFLRFTHVNGPLSHQKCFYRRLLKNVLVRTGMQNILHNPFLKSIVLYSRLLGNIAVHILLWPDFCNYVEFVCRYFIIYLHKLMISIISEHLFLCSDYGAGSETGRP